MDSPDVDRLNRLLNKAAKSAGNSWLLTPDQIADLAQDMWVGYLEKPTRQQALDGASDGETVRYLRGQADQVLSGTVRADDLASGDRMYSSDSIKQVLKGAIYNPFLESIVHLAVARLDDRHPPYAEALKLRYIDGEVPPQGSKQVLLTRAHQALAEEVHAVIVELEDSDRTRVDPDAVKAQTGPATPTEDVALLIATNAEAAAVFHDEARDEAEAFAREYVRTGTGTAGTSVDIFDGAFNGMGAVAMYRSWVIPESFPNQPQALLQNWSQEDLEMYVGGEYAR